MEKISTGEDLRTWRQLNRISQKQLAQRIGYSISAISHCEYNNKLLTSKMIGKIMEYDLELNPIPKIDKISEKWNSIEYYRNIYDSEMMIIEKAIIELLSINVNKLGYDKTGGYLNFLGKSLKALVDLKNYSFTDSESYKTDASKILGRILKEGKLYLIKKEQPH